MFEFLTCDLCCFISTTMMSPLHCSLYKLNSFFSHKYYRMYGWLNEMYFSVLDFCTLWIFLAFTLKQCCC